MGKLIKSIRINQEGDLLFIREFREENGRYFIKYRSMVNDIPFQEIELFVEDIEFVIVGGNGKVLYRFMIEALEGLINEFVEEHEQTT